MNAKQLGLPDVAFVGKAGVGKSTAASILAGLFGYRTLSFAGPLKDIAQWLWGEGARSDREKLQKLGVAVRDIHTDSWVDLLLAQVRAPGSIMEPDRPVVIDDCRFENEWYALKAEGFVIVRLEAPRSARIDRLKANGKWQDEEQLEHVSETAIDHLDADHTIKNDGSKTLLEDDLIDVLLKERRRR